MIKIFTGGHIRFGLEVRQLLAGKKINENLSQAADSISVIRQIVNNFNNILLK